MNTLSFSEQLSHIGQLTQVITNQPNDPLYVVIDQGNGVLKVKTTKLAKSIEYTVEHYLYEIMEGFQIHGFHPYVSIFVNNALDCNLRSAIELQRSLKKTNDLYQLGGDYDVILDLIFRMKTFVMKILEITGSFEFKKLIDKANRTANKNHEGMMRYIDSLFEHYSRLVVIRLDLYEDSPIMSQSDIEKKYWQAKYHFKRLLNNAKMNCLFDAMVGYIWSLEYGPERGYHYHFVFFFDSSQVIDDVYLAWQIGEYWKGVVTDGRGSYWNCNAEKKKYPHLGIGIIHHSDVEKINCLKRAAAYLVKVDHYVRMLTPDNGRTFGRGEILPPRTGTVGRPRAA
ncbi:YagK/YfjJ domain-containing protein [Methylomicrobium sp. RS1]|uniref:YagK/YfjJ domain-containing protein n=1 Tax=Candidatus Methylomicrobium oryzae TaxID=2802053 RepID=UPI001922B358|nr:inovirus-type Gp2 protein [Methylomicrobium sp. RS1]MBL1265478.1 inovirus-type Gp2 protein [Methylomicrobium sp. RS1]